MSNTTTDPTPETAKDRQLIYWQQQCAGQEHVIESQQAEIERLRTSLSRIATSTDYRGSQELCRNIAREALEQANDT